MIKVERNVLHLKLHQYYFLNDLLDDNRKAHLEGFSHSFIPRENLTAFETVHIQLTNSDVNLFMSLDRTTRRLIRRAGEQALTYVVLEKPTNQDLKKFQIYYNEFARHKKTFTCNAFHMKTMQLLRDKNCLVLMYMVNQENEVLCYRVYIVDQQVAMNLYAASHFRLANLKEQKKLLSQAHRFLIWKSILYFKEKNYEIYDMGGLTEDPNIRRFKLGFGGDIVTVYSGYEANSMLGSIVLKIRNWKLAFANAGGLK